LQKQLNIQQQNLSSLLLKFTDVLEDGRFFAISSWSSFLGGRMMLVMNLV